MTFGENITYQRKQRKWSQDDLAKMVGTSAPIIGRYERNEIKPSIDVASKIAEAMDLTLDFLVNGKGVLFDAETTRRIKDIQELNDEDQKHIFFTIDALIRDSKARKAYK